MSEPRSGIQVLQEAGNEAHMPPAAKLLGWKLLEIEPGRAKAEFTAREDFVNPTGNIQGGLLAAMLDDSMGPAGFSLLDETQFAPTLEMKINFMRAARPGKLIGEGKVVHQTKSTFFLVGELRTEDGTLIATGTATARIVSLKPLA